jgi:soluble lytic murein transglycosylase-like protein
MDIQSVRTLFELKALQNINSSTVQNLFESDNSLFDTFFSELLNEQQSSSSDLSAQLGSIANAINSNTQLQSYFNSAEGQSMLSANPYLASLLLEESAAISPSVEQYTADDTSDTSYENSLAGASKYANEITKAANTYHLPEKLIASVMKQESNFNPNATSSAGATGLMQLMPQTAKFLGVTNRIDPEQNIMGGAKYLRQMLDKFDNNLSLALAAYNAGPGNVTKYNGIPPFKETQNYVKNIINYYTA